MNDNDEETGTGILTLEEPSKEEIESASGRGVFGQEIAPTLTRTGAGEGGGGSEDNRLPPGSPSAQEIEGLHDYFGNQFTPSELFVLTNTEGSNSFPDTYFTFMEHGSLQNYAAEATRGVAFMAGHRHGDFAVGYSYSGEVRADPEAVSGKNALMAFLLPGSEPFSRLKEKFYIPRGDGVAHKSNDSIIKSVVNRTTRDLSIGFVPGDIVCNLCRSSILTWGCEHCPGIRYPLEEVRDVSRVEQIRSHMAENESNVRCLGGVRDGHLAETSMGYKGSTPDANIAPYVPMKARMLASAGALTRTEAEQLIKLQQKLGVRLVDPAGLAVANRSTFIFKEKEKGAEEAVQGAAAPSTPPSTTTTTTPAPAARSTTTSNNNKETKTMAQAPRPVSGNTMRRQDPASMTDPNAAPSDPAQVGEVAQVVQAVADQATSDASSIADQITALASQRDNLQAQVDACTAQISAMQSASPPTDPAVVQSTIDQCTALQAQVDDLNNQIAALQAELDGVNNTADQLGGTATPPPDATPAPPGSPPGAVAPSPAQVTGALAKVLTNIRAARMSLDASFRTTLWYMERARRPYQRDTGAGGYQPAGSLPSDNVPPPPPAPTVSVPQDIIDQIMQAAQAIQTVLQGFVQNAAQTPAATGGTPGATVRKLNDLLRTPEDKIMFGMIRRRLGREPNFSDVQQIMLDAEAGRGYRARLVEDAVAWRVNALGANGIEQYREVATRYTVEMLEIDIDTFSQAANNTWTPQRRIISETMQADGRLIQETRNGNGKSSGPGSNGHMQDTATQLNNAPRQGRITRG